MIQARFKPYILKFKQASGTSRGVLHTKETWILELSKDGQLGIGECALFRGLSYDDVPNYSKKLQWVCDHIDWSFNDLMSELTEFPSIQFGLETAFKSLSHKDPFQIVPSEFSKGKKAIPINGLVWMGDFEFMRRQIIQKIEQGFTCIKLKIGAIKFEDELQLLRSIRKEFTENEMELRVDANGAFSPEDALEKLKRLSEFKLHSIEQPVKQGQFDTIAELCLKSPLDIALDEELIGVLKREQKKAILEQIRPQYIILKPALVGGFKGSEEWIRLAENLNIDWWITSALESNIGLNAIAQWTYSLNSLMTQGLGTGGLFTNNFKSPLLVKNGNLYYQPEVDWEYKF